MDEQTTTQPDDKKFAREYVGLGRLLHIVRWTQHLLAIIAEALILLSFAMSGMDVSLGGALAEVPFIKVLWAGMFALGIDTAFALSWVRLRQSFMRRQWLPFIWNLLLALAMSVIVFQPLAIQLLQQSLGLNFNQAVASLGINIVFLTYARAGVAVFLGAILAITNTADEAARGKDAPRPARWFMWLRKQSALVTPVTVNEEQPLLDVAASAGLSITTEIAIDDQETIPMPIVEVLGQPEPPRYDTPEQRAERVSEIDLTDLSAPERVAKVLELFPDLSDRELGKLSGMAAATAKKHRETLKMQVTPEGGQ
jgi:hypothetical protein